MTFSNRHRKKIPIDNTLFFAFLFAASLSAPACAEEGACSALFAAMSRLAATPHHEYLSEKSPGRSSESEIIDTETMHFLKVKGKWIARARSAKVAAAQISRPPNDARLTCRSAGGENVDGQATTVVNTRHETDDGSADQRVWISNASGLPLRQTIDIDIGDKAGKTHKELRYEYTNVAAPTG